jgi:hypothetical protein
MKTPRLLAALSLALTISSAQTTPVFTPVPTVTSGYVIPADSGDYVFVGPNINQLTISYPASLAGQTTPERISLTLRALNLVKPTVSTTITPNGDGSFDYTYSISNDISSLDPIKVWSLAMPAIDAATSASHPTWAFSQQSANGDQTPPKGMISMSPVMIANWLAPGGESVVAGASMAAFKLNSPYLPGFTIIYARSAVDYAAPANLPPAVNNQLNLVRQRDWMNKRLVGIGPRFPADFPVSVIAADFKEGVARLTENGTLSSASSSVIALNSALDVAIAGQGGVPTSVIAAAQTSTERSIASAVSASLK